MIREAAKKVFFSGLRGGGGLRAWPLRKNTFFWSSRKKNPKNVVATKLEGEGDLVAGH